MRLYIIEYTSAHFEGCDVLYCLVWAANSNAATLAAAEHMDTSMYELHAHDYDTPDGNYAYSDEQCHTVNYCELFTPEHPHIQSWFLEPTHYPVIGSLL